MVVQHLKPYGTWPGPGAKHRGGPNLPHGEQRTVLCLTVRDFNHIQRILISGKSFFVILVILCLIRQKTCMERGSEVP